MKHSTQEIQTDYPVVAEKRLTVIHRYVMLLKGVLGEVRQGPFPHKKPLYSDNSTIFKDSKVEQSKLAAEQVSTLSFRHVVQTKLSPEMNRYAVLVTSRKRQQQLRIAVMIKYTTTTPIYVVVTTDNQFYILLVVPLIFFVVVKNPIIIPIKFAAVETFTPKANTCVVITRRIQPTA
jgi:hypothetical protein